MITFKQLREKCWSGYKRVPGTKAFSKGSCVKEMAGAGAVGGSAGPTNVTGPQSATDPISATAVDMRKRKKKYPVLARKAPK
jgi:hypothetical protein